MNSPPAAHPPLDWTAARVAVTGGGGFLGSAVMRVLAGRGVDAGRSLAVRSRDFDLTTREACRRLMTGTFGGLGPTVVLHCAGAVGGIQANKDQPGRFFHDNMAMSLHLIDEARRAWSTGARADAGVLVQVGSMTSYPADAPIPFREECLWRGYPDGASAPYGVAKLAAWQMLDAYHRQYGLRAAYVIPVNLYGPGDNIADVRNAHVAGSLIKRFVDAHRAGDASVACWGSGAPTREFLYIDDAAEGVVRAAEHAWSGGGDPAPINLGSGHEISIRHLAEVIACAIGYSGRIDWDITKPDGQPRRCLDPARAAAMLGWRAQMPLEQGIRQTVAWYRSTLV